MVTMTFLKLKSRAITHLTNRPSDNSFLSAVALLSCRLDSACENKREKTISVSPPLPANNFSYTRSSRTERTITAQRGRRQVKTIQSALLMSCSRSGVVLPFGIDMCIDLRIYRFVGWRHRLREHRVDVTIVSSGLKHRGPVNLAGVVRVLSWHDWTLGVLVNNRRFSLFNGRKVNIQLVAMCIITRLDEVRVLLGCSHPRGSLMRLPRGVRVVRMTTVHPIDRGHRKSQRLLLREPGPAGGQPITVHGPLAESRTH